MGWEWEGLLRGMCEGLTPPHHCHGCGTSVFRALQRAGSWLSSPSTRTLRPLGVYKLEPAGSDMQRLKTATRDTRETAPSVGPDISPGGSPRAPVVSSEPSHGRQPSDSKDRRTKELCAWFGIPETETLLNDFHCALRKRVLLQGRLFVFEHYVCFNSNVFGYVNRKAIALSDVESVMKKTYFKFPNSIEIEDSNGHRDFFTSFLTRESAFRAIITAWGQVRPDLAEPLLALLEEDPSSMQRKPGSSMMSIFAGPSIFFNNGRKSEVPTHRRLSSAGPARAEKPATLPEDPDAISEDQGVHGPCLTATSADADDGECEGPGHQPAMLPRGLTLCNLDAKPDDDSNHESSETMWDTVASAPGPVARHKDSKLLLSTTLPGTPRDFFNLIVADESSFMEDVLVELGNRKIDVAAWKAAEELGFIRDLQMVAPIKGAFSSWGVPTTRCFVTQRFCRYPNNHLLFESQQTNLDIPYGDYFTVDMRWDVHCDPNSRPDEPRLQVELHVRTPFSRSCLFRKIIESGVYTQAKENYTFVLDRANMELQRRQAARRSAGAAPLGMGAPAMPGSLRASLSAPQSATLAGVEGGVAALVPDAGTVFAGQVEAAAVAPSGPSVRRSSGLGGVAGLGADALPTSNNNNGGGAGGGAPGWLGTARSVLVVVLLLLMCLVQFYILLLLRPGAGAASGSWVPGGAAHAAPDPPSASLLGLQARTDPSVLLQRLLLLQQELVALQQKADTATADVACLMRALGQCAAPTAEASSTS